MASCFSCSTRHSDSLLCILKQLQAKLPPSHIRSSAAISCKQLSFHTLQCRQRHLLDRPVVVIPMLRATASGCSLDAESQPAAMRGLEAHGQHELLSQNLVLDKGPRSCKPLRHRNARSQAPLKNAMVNKLVCRSCRITPRGDKVHCCCKSYDCAIEAVHGHRTQNENLKLRLHVWVHTRQCFDPPSFGPRNSTLPMAS